MVLCGVGQRARGEGQTHAGETRAGRSGESSAASTEAGIRQLRPSDADQTQGGGDPGEGGLRGRRPRVRVGRAAGEARGAPGEGRGGHFRERTASNAAGASEGLGAAGPSSWPPSASVGTGPPWGSRERGVETSSGRTDSTEQPEKWEGTAEWGRGVGGHTNEVIRPKRRENLRVP